MPPDLWSRLLAIVLAACPLAASADMYDVFRQVARSVAKVEAANGDGSVSIGSAVVVAPDLVVTNCHVTQRAHAVEVVQGGLRAPAQSQSSDLPRDLCVLRVDMGQLVPVVPLARHAPRIGQKVYAVGFVLGAAPRFSEGHVNALYDFQGARVIQASAAFTSGASGGGLFDEQGRLLGIVTFRHYAGGAYHFSLPATWIREAIAHYQGRSIAPQTGEPFWHKVAGEQPFFLQAARYEAAGDWRGLARTAERWVDSERQNPSAWYALGEAALQLNQNGRAVSALRRAVALDEGFETAWYLLGLAHARAGDYDTRDSVRQVLEELDSPLAAQLALDDPACTGTLPPLCRLPVVEKPR